MRLLPRGLAHRVEVTQTWDDLVLAEDTAERIVSLVWQVRHARGVAAVFSGPPGTGKTMVAGLIARELGLDLYQVDLRRVVSTWLGETENNLSRLFDGAKRNHALLLFDEADALLGHLIKRAEASGGVAIFTAHPHTTLDRALERRLAAHVVFAPPSEHERVRLWQRQTITGRAPLARDVSHHELARAFPRMTGADIRNAAIAAAFLAAAAGAPTITQDHLTRAARAEHRRMGHLSAEITTRSDEPRRASCHASTVS